jgi:hypothetical protein
MPKLTETTNDHLRRKGNGRTPAAVRAHPPRITEPHEPLSTGESPVLPMILPPPNPADAVVNATGPVHIQTVSATPAPQPLKVALIGTAPSSRMLAPYNDPTWKIWCCSPGNMNVVPRFDVWFELHGNMLWSEYKDSYGLAYVEWLKKLTVPLFMQSQEWCPNAITFPMREMVAEFGGDFFTSSFTWMMAFAIKSGASEIALYGIDMASRDEYILQRPGFYFFRTMARMRGIKVIAPHESDIMQPPGLYGYSDVTPFGRKLYARKREIAERIAGLRQQEEAAKTNRIYLEGAAEDNDYTMAIWMGAQDNISPLMELPPPVQVEKIKPAEVAAK